MPAVPGWAPEHEDFRASVRRFVERSWSEETVRRLMDTDDGHDPALWRQATEQVGLAALLVPEESGGAGLTLLEVGLVAEELGRGVVGGPFLSSAVLGVSALVAAGAGEDLLGPLAEGASIATVALEDHDVRVTDGRLHGTAPFVLDGALADLVLVPVDGVLYAVSSDEGLTRTRLTTVDATRKQATLTFDGAPAREIGPVDTGYLKDVAAVVVAAEQVGGAQRCLEMSVEYAKVRTQFGQVIGSFQAIKHRCADMLQQVELARSAMHQALHAAADESPLFPALAAAAKAFCSEAYTFTSAETVQVHGGIGFTWEHPAHLYYKRAAADALLFGDPDTARAAFADRIQL
ncbi:acyl-CoA dehydrogenase family protein [Pseudonocardia ailaonensis]|uniref:Acyl-CoA dehydrogenase family protein n=1 Tax=Pseudonocardia ailaonensis TaxID=367279 RepID=A0ABN2NDB1_9PSEU